MLRSLPGRKKERKLNLHSKTCHGTHDMDTELGPVVAIDDPTVLSGWRAWPGAGWGNTQKFCSQRESKEGQANKEG